jgi:dTDP-4-dehydrorhamnose reductase
VKILVIGLGQLGKDLVKVLGETHQVAGLDVPDVDITDAESVEIVMNTYQPDLVINAAAYTDVEKAEDDEATAYAVNATGAGNIAESAASRDIPVVLYSTDFVFDGKKGSDYLPHDATAPLSVYGASKLAGEVETADANPKHFILRTAWLYGPGGNNFIEKIIGWAAKMYSLRVVTDEVGSPTHTWDVAEATAKLIETEAYGIYHVVNQGVCSRFELATAIVESMELGVELKECLSKEFPTQAERPEYSVLDCSALEAVIGQPMPEWRETLARYLTRRGTV